MSKRHQTVSVTLFVLDLTGMIGEVDSVHNLPHASNRAQPSLDRSTHIDVVSEKLQWEHGSFSTDVAVRDMRLNAEHTL